jgi:Spy/CpxP family protein refolding chaperone
MNFKKQRPDRFLIAIAISVIVPVGLGAQHHQHHTRDSSSMHGSHTAEMMGAHEGSWMDMMSMMPGGETMMGMPMGSLMQRVMQLQPSFALTHSDALDLSGEQIARLEQLVVAQESAHQEHMRSMLEDSQSLVELFESDDVDVEEIRTLAEGAMKPFRALQWRAITDARAVRDLLTPAQREAARSLPISGMMMRH